MDNAVVDLADAIEALRLELTDAMNRGNGQGMQFVLEPIELTVEAVITREMNGKIGWKILEAGASREAVRTQTLTLRLDPHWKRPDGTLTKDFTIAQAAPQGDTFSPTS